MHLVRQVLSHSGACWTWSAWWVNPWMRRQPSCRPRRRTACRPPFTVEARRIVSLFAHQLSLTGVSGMSGPSTSLVRPPAARASVIRVAEDVHANAMPARPRPSSWDGAELPPSTVKKVSRISRAAIPGWRGRRARASPEGLSSRRTIGFSPAAGKEVVRVSHGGHPGRRARAPAGTGTSISRHHLDGARLAIEVALGHLVVLSTRTSRVYLPGSKNPVGPSDRVLQNNSTRWSRAPAATPWEPTGSAPTAWRPPTPASA